MLFIVYKKMVLEIACFAAGCFWNVEHIFSRIPGVVSTQVGYMGGKTKNPNYEDVLSGKTGHAETVQIIFNSNKISYKKLLDIFWNIHNPTTLDRQGPYQGNFYRSCIFFYNKSQKKIAQISKNYKQKKINFRIVTEIVPASKFYKAESYHQRYIEKRGIARCTA